MKTMLLLAVIFFSSPPVRCRTDAEHARRGKIETILRLQDLRAPLDRGIASFLSDPDPVVRRRAAIACGSLQDTAAIGLLSAALGDTDSAVAVAAAFALGQTGTRLSEPGRRTLERALIRGRLRETRAAGRLIEEIGKFGTREGMNELLLLAPEGHTSRLDDNLIMSVARFAIRGLSSPGAVRYLLRFVGPDERAPWQVLYALQRTGDTPGARSALALLSRLEHAPDPLVRMNLATLMGKLPGAGPQAGLLVRMAGTDTDWRVRVNALKALGQFSRRDNPGVIEAFRRAFADTNLHVAITALSAFPAGGGEPRDTNLEVREATRDIARIADNGSGEIPWQVQAEASLALAKTASRLPGALLRSGGAGLPRRLRARMLAAAGESGDTSAGRILAGASAGNDPLIVCAALEGLSSLAHRKSEIRSLADSALASAIRALGVRDMAIVSTAAGILEDSLFRSDSSVGPLVTALESLRVPGDAETMQDVIRALGTLGDLRATGALTRLLACGDQSVAEASAAALRKLTGNDYSGQIAGKPGTGPTDGEMAFLGALPPRVRVNLETSRGEILIDLDRDAAPFTTMSIVKLAERGFYDGLTFHRFVPNFVVQGGDPRGDGWGGAGYSLRSEFSLDEYGTGTVGIASAGKDTEGSQFFITLSPQPHLDGRYTVVGNVVEGMGVVDRIQVGDRILGVTIVR